MDIFTKIHTSSFFCTVTQIGREYPAAVFQVIDFNIFNEFFPREILCSVAHSTKAGVSSSVRGLITWQWAPDRRPARQVGKLLSLTCRAALSRQPYLHKATRAGASISPLSRDPAALSIRFGMIVGRRMNKGRHLCRPLLCLHDGDQAFFGVCDMHQPFAFTDLPGNSRQGPRPVLAPP